MSFMQELKRRNVLRVATAYLAGGWLLVQVADTVFPVYGLGTAALNLLITVLAIGFPAILIVTWVFELTPEGLKLDRDVDRSVRVPAEVGRRLDRLIIVLLTLALGYFAVDKFILEPARDAEMVEMAVMEGRSQALIESYGEKSIAVLPFQDLSPEGDQEYFADGMSEELLNLLAKIPELRVISRSSAFSFKGQHADIPTVAARLNVAHVLEGSVRKAGQQLRVTAQLIDARADIHVWSETYDRELANIFDIQDEIAEAVVTQLKIRLLTERHRAKEVDPEAYALFLQARHFVNQGSAESWQHARTYLDQVLEIAPDYAPAWGELSRFYANQIFSHRIAREKGYPKLTSTIMRALDLDPGDALTHSRYGWALMMWEGDIVSAAEHQQKALQLEPGNAAVLANVAPLLGTLGRHQEALGVLEHATQRDPLNATLYSNLTVAYIQLGRLDEAEEAARTGIRISPRQFGGHGILARVLLLKGEPAAALEVLRQEPLPFLRLAGESMAHYDLGDTAASNQALAALVDKFGTIAQAFIANVYADRGDSDRAFEWLQQALRVDGPRVLIYVLHAPEYELLRRDPRWRALTDGTGLSAESLRLVSFKLDLPLVD